MRAHRQSQALSNARRRVLLLGILWLVALYSVQVAASVHTPNHAQPYQKCQIDRHAHADLLPPAPLRLAGTAVSFHVRLPRTGVGRIAGFIPAQTKSRDPPHRSTAL